MKFAKDKTMAIAIALFLLSSAVIVALPNANAQNTKETYAFIGAVPNPIGVGQQTLLNLGITDSLQVVGDEWKDLTVTVTKPDGTTETLGPFNTDSTGSTGTIYTPTMAGNYTLQTHFPAQWYNYTGYGLFGYVESKVFYKASDSDNLTLVVQEEPLEYYLGVPLPTEYWSRPIDAQARGWYTIAGNWLYNPDNLFAPYNDGPETAHVLWTKEITTTGGLVGGDVGLNESSGQGAVGYGIGDAYEGKWTSRFIISGKLIYSEGGASSMGTTFNPVVYHCVDLHTGEELWAKTFGGNETISFGQILYWQTFNYQGAFAYLWTAGAVDYTGASSGSTWKAYDADDGDLRFTILHVPSGTTLRDANGAIYILQTDLTNGWMALWNMTTLCTYNEYSAWLTANWGNSVNGQTFDAAANTTAAKSAWSLNVTIPKGLPGSVQTTFYDDRIIGSNLVGSFFGGGSIPTNVVVWGLSLKHGQEGTLLFNTTWAAPTDWIAGNQSISWVAFSEADKVGVLWSKELRHQYGVSLETGKLLWGPTPSQYFLDSYVATNNLIAYGRLYSCGVSGIMYCYDITTGELLWTYQAEDPYTEILWNNNWWLDTAFITDGKIYVGHEEHSPNQPLPRGAPFICLNATTGDVIWRANGLFRQTHWGGLAIIGDSIIATMDTYDQRIYAIGKGPSATTVNAPGIGVTAGDSLVITGTVTDISPGTEEYALTAHFPNGVPAVSDASMSDWMLYVYKQFPRPSNATGVPVTLSVVDANNNSREIGTTVSDASGFFSFNWTPDITGSYTVTATFAGSQAYYGSSAETSFAVDPAAPTASPYPTVSLASTQTYIIGIGIAIIVVIIIGFALLFLTLRKRPSLQM